MHFLCLCFWRLYPFSYFWTALPKRLDCKGRVWSNFNADNRQRKSSYEMQVKDNKGTQFPCLFGYCNPSKKFSIKGQGPSANVIQSPQSIRQTNNINSFPSLHFFKTNITMNSYAFVFAALVIAVQGGSLRVGRQGWGKLLFQQVLFSCFGRILTFIF